MAAIRAALQHWLDADDEPSCPALLGQAIRQVRSGLPEPSSGVATAVGTGFAAAGHGSQPGYGKTLIVAAQSLSNRRFKDSS